MSHMQHSVYHALLMLSIFNAAFIMSRRSGAKMLEKLINAGERER